MSVLISDIIAYGAANHQETDSGTQGGAIDTSVRVVFTDINPTGALEVVSENSGDTTQTMTVTGLNAAGEAATLGPVTLTGQTPASMGGTSLERIYKGTKSATTSGAVAMMATTNERTGTCQAGSANKTASKAAFAVLDSGASASDDAYKDMVLRTTGGTGPNQIRQVIKYDGTTKEAFVYPDWSVVPDATTTFEIAQGMVFEKTPNEVLEVRRPFINTLAEAEGGSSRDYYEKIFFSNEHATLSLTSAQIVEQADPSTFLEFGLPSTLDDTGTSTDRRTAPGGITFNSSTKNVANSQNHTADAAQGTWLKLTLAAGTLATKTSYTLRETGSTV